MKNKTALTLISLFASPLVYAVQPVIMSGPSPAIATTFPAGSSQTFVYTITNRVPKRLPITINGLSGTVNRTTVPNDCGDTLPAAKDRTPATCNIGISITPTQGNVGSTTNQTFQVDYQGRRPLTASISFSTRSVRLYVTNSTGQNYVSQCFLNIDSGVISGCRNFSDPTFISPADIVINPAGTFAYVSNFGNDSISTCPIQANGFLSACTAFTSPAIDGTSGITINRAGTRIYTSNFVGDTLGICLINSAGRVSQCSSSAPGPINNPVDIVLDPLNQFSYSTNNGLGTVLRCQITASGSFGSCATAAITDPTGISINAAGTILYVNNAGPNTVSVCPILPGIPFLGACTAQNPSGTFAMFFGKSTIFQNSFLFVVNQAASTVSVCRLDAQGNLIACPSSNPDGAFANPQGIALY
jgi:DNA-binding beta-propeller fold protein YncE